MVNYRNRVRQYFGPRRTLTYVDVEELLIYQNTLNVSRPHKSFKSLKLS